MLALFKNLKCYLIHCLFGVLNFFEYSIALCTFATTACLKAADTVRGLLEGKFVPSWELQLFINCLSWETLPSRPQSNKMSNIK